MTENSRMDKDYILELNKGIRVDTLDKLDQISYHQRLHSNFIKWWSVNLVDPEEEEQPYDPDAAAEELLQEALGGMDIDSTAEPEVDLSDPATAEAMEIFRRLEAEAAADEAAKQAEIEAAKVAAGLGNSQSSVSDLVKSAQQ